MVGRFPAAFAVPGTARALVSAPAGDVVSVTSSVAVASTACAATSAVAVLAARRSVPDAWHGLAAAPLPGAPLARPHGGRLRRSTAGAAAVVVPSTASASIVSVSVTMVSSVTGSPLEASRASSSPWSSVSVSSASVSQAASDVAYTSSSSAAAGTAPPYQRRMRGGTGRRAVSRIEYEARGPVPRRPSFRMIHQGTTECSPLGNLLRSGSVRGPPGCESPQGTAISRTTGPSRRRLDEARPCPQARGRTPEGTSMTTQIVILAAGMGSRLGRSLPKPLTELSDGRTIMQQQFDNIRAAFGSSARVTIVVGYKSEYIVEAFPEANFVYNESYDSTNTSKSLLRALKATGKGGVLWMNGDVVFRPAGPGACRRHDGRGPFVRQRQHREGLRRRGQVHGRRRGLHQGAVEARRGWPGRGRRHQLRLVRRQAGAHRQLGRVDDQEYFEGGIEAAIAEDGLRWNRSTSPTCTPSRSTSPRTSSARTTCSPEPASGPPRRFRPKGNRDHSECADRARGCRPRGDRSNGRRYRHALWLLTVRDLGCATPPPRWGTSGRSSTRS